MKAYNIILPINVERRYVDDCERVLFEETRDSVSLTHSYMDFHRNVWVIILSCLKPITTQKIQDIMDQFIYDDDVKYEILEV